MKVFISYEDIISVCFILAGVLVGAFLLMRLKRWLYRLLVAIVGLMMVGYGLAGFAINDTSWMHSVAVTGTKVWFISPGRIDSIQLADVQSMDVFVGCEITCISVHTIRTSDRKIEVSTSVPKDALLSGGELAHLVAERTGLNGPIRASGGVLQWHR